MAARTQAIAVRVRRMSMVVLGVMSRAGFRIGLVSSSSVRKISYSHCVAVYQLAIRGRFHNNLLYGKRVNDYRGIGVAESVTCI